MFAMFFGLSLVDCTSSLTFLPFMGNFHPSYTTSYFVGMGVSALVPSVLALIQGAGRFKCVDKSNNVMTNVSFDYNSSLDSLSDSFTLSTNKTVTTQLLMYPEQVRVKSTYGDTICFKANKY